MRHRRTGRILGRKRNQRKALLRSLAHALLAQGKIMTTEAKAKELRRYVEPLITLAREDSVLRRRRVGRILAPSVAHKLFTQVAPRFRTRPGGYTRIIKVPERQGDAARRAFIELLNE